MLGQEFDHMHTLPRPIPVLLVLEEKEDVGFLAFHAAVHHHIMLGVTPTIQTGTFWTTASSRDEAPAAGPQRQVQAPRRSGRKRGVVHNDHLTRQGMSRFSDNDNTAGTSKT